MPTGFHVRHDLAPIPTYELLTLLNASSKGQTQQDLQYLADLNGYKLRQRKDYYKLLLSLVELELISDSGHIYKLTPIGRVIAQIVIYQQDLLPDFIHFLYYTCFDLDPKKRFSWSYRQVCDFLWHSAPIAINRDRLVNLVTRDATQVFNLSGVSFSKSSIAGILNWLLELSPPCIAQQDKGQIFTRREYCSIEIFALALNHIFLLHKQNEPVSIPLTPEMRDVVSRICLITPDAFSDMLSKVEATFSNIHIRRERGERFYVKNFSWSTLEEN